MGLLCGLVGLLLVVGGASAGVGRGRNSHRVSSPFLILM